MKTKNLKVAYTSRYTQKNPCTVPQIKMEGKWLEELGFSVGSTVVVEYEEGSIHIRPMTEEELLINEQKSISLALKRKEKELLTIQSDYQKLSKVAEASGIYGKSIVNKSK